MHYTWVNSIHMVLIYFSNVKTFEALVRVKFCWGLGLG